MRRIAIFLLFFVQAAIIWGTIINIPDDYATIQDGIDASLDGDEVIVAPGIYVENIDFEGKAIIVGSWYHTTQDTSYISQTIIDGNDNGSVVTFENEEDSSSVLIGFTIINGYSENGGGIYCFYTSPNLYNLNIQNNFAGEKGGGLYTHHSSLEVFSVKISANHSDFSGGGIYSISCTENHYTNVVIKNNTSGHYGGGFYCGLGDPVLSDVTIRNNSSGMRGGGLYLFSEVLLQFNLDNRCNIYSNTISGRGNGCDIFAENTVEIIVDTFTVINPTDFHTSPLENFSFDILHGTLEQVCADLYVSPEGDNSNSGLSVEYPLKTIHYASSIIQAYNIYPHTIYLTNGIYSPSSNEEHFPVCLPSYVSLIGEDTDTVILDAESTAGVIRIDGADGITISNMTLTNGLASNGGGISALRCDPLIENLIITGNSANNGGGIYCYQSDILIENVRIENNSAEGGTGSGGGMCFRSSNPTLIDVIVENNSASGIFGAGGGIYFYLSTANLHNVRIRNNIAEKNGGGISCSSSLQMENVTIVNNSAGENGGGIYCLGADIFFDIENRCNIYDNNIDSNENGNDIYTSSNMDVIVDTFSVIRPTVYYTTPISEFSFDIIQGIHDQVNADLYVSPEGDDDNSGLTAANPLKTIRHACNYIYTDSENPHIIFLTEGIYSYSGNGEFFPVELPDYVSLIGISREDVILDAERDGGVIAAIDHDNVMISNLTVTNGISQNGGGIYCSNTEMIFDNICLNNNTGINKGGGVYCLNSNPVFSNIIIENNSALLQGGGFCCISSNPVLTNVSISNNTCTQQGGGFYCYESSPAFANVSITDNISEKEGGGMYINYSTPQFANANSSIYNNYSRLYYGNDLFSSDLVQVTVDTFTVINPSGMHAYPLENFAFNIANGFHDQVNTSLFVSPYGSNTNSGLNAENPLKTIIFACSIILADEEHPQAIYLAEGTYKFSTNREIFPISLPSNISLIGENMDSVILDADSIASIVKFHEVSNTTISNLTITDGDAWRGGGIYCLNSDPLISNIKILNCNSAWGGGVYCFNSNIILSNSVIIDNHTVFGGGICVENSSPLLTNNTISNNFAANYGGGMFCLGNCEPILINCILWSNLPYEIAFEHVVDNTLTIACSDIQGGLEAIYTDNQEAVNWLDSNLDTDPLFQDSWLGDYSLTDGSPCIDAGIACFEYEGEILIELDETEYYGIAPDMGAFEYGMVDTHELIIQNSKLKIQNFPNPFNPETNILFELATDNKVLIEIFNIKGQKVTTLADSYYKAGTHQITWNAENLSSGIYLMNMNTNGITRHKKLILLK